MKAYKLFLMSAMFLGIFLSCKSDKTNTAASQPSNLVEKTEAPKTDPSKLNWMNMQAAADYPNPEKKKFFIDVYTDWCGWCKVMDKNTFSDPNVVKALNERFHVVKFNAEQQQAITFKNKNYEWMNMGRNGVNTLAMELLKGNLSYPSYAYLDENKNLIKVSMGFMPPDQFLQELATVK